MYNTRCALGDFRPDTCEGRLTMAKSCDWIEFVCSDYNNLPFKVTGHGLDSSRLN